MWYLVVRIPDVYSFLSFILVIPSFAMFSITKRGRLHCSNSTFDVIHVCVFVSGLISFARGIKRWTLICGYNIFILYLPFCIFWLYHIGNCYQLYIWRLCLCKFYTTTVESTLGKSPVAKKIYHWKYETNTCFVPNNWIKQQNVTGYVTLL